MEFGIRLPSAGPFSEGKLLIELTESAEKLGYDSVWMNDHLIWTTAWSKSHIQMGSLDIVDEWPEPNRFETISSLAFLAGLTKRIKIGTCVIVAPFRNPILMARQMTSIDCLSGGRLILGISVGNIEEEFISLGIPWKKRGAITDEYLAAMIEIWKKPISSFNGKYLKFPPLEFYPKPVQKPHIPIWIGGKSKWSFKRIAKFGNGWTPSGTTPAQYEKGKILLNKYLNKVGRNIDEIAIQWEAFLCIDETRKKAVQKCRSLIETRYKTLERANKTNMIGSPKDVINKIEEYAKVGVEYYHFKIIAPNYDDVLKQMRFISDDVMPLFK